MKITSLFFLFLSILLLSQNDGHTADSLSAPHPALMAKSPIPVGTVATWAKDAQVPRGWLPCNGQAVPSAYPALRALMSNVPNYNSAQFLRGSTSGAGRSFADSTRSHMHTIPQHSHTVSGTASPQSVTVGSQSVTGTAAGQKFMDDTTNIFPTAWGGSQQMGYGETPMYFGHDYYAKYADASAVSGRTSGGTYSTGGGTISGWTNLAGNPTDPTGGAETAPQHTLVKFIIKAD